MKIFPNFIFKTFFNFRFCRPQLILMNLFVCVSRRKNAQNNDFSSLFEFLNLIYAHFCIIYDRVSKFRQPNFHLVFENSIFESHLAPTGFKILEFVNSGFKQFWGLAIFGVLGFLGFLVLGFRF